MFGMTQKLCSITSIVPVTWDVWLFTIVQVRPDGTPLLIQLSSIYTLHHVDRQSVCMNSMLPFVLTALWDVNYLCYQTVYLSSTNHKAKVSLPSFHCFSFIKGDLFS